MIIRKAEARDIPRVIKLLKQILKLHADLRPDIFRRDRLKFTEKDLAALFEAANCPCFVAEKDGVCVGYALCRIIKTDASPNLAERKVLFIDDLCVDEALRGNGIGQKMTARAVKYAKSIGANAVELNLWEANRGAAEFYESFGFKTQRRQMELLLKK